ncbi:hypothetical protein [Desulfosporosinus nitroreducens]|uniref:Uncharacterized protein n=1 Tax=Desulfosporosinus nitroreducens TaxID=2018668 RepID=A0ABT8QQF2_9FIRM|nr:hypothetical protein [Desulfosporosinus nitroreducens]MDO0823567.1 hypothetical protein [Desulfosporosinus nitroreducens]
MSHKDEATREALASELGELKDKYSHLQQAYTKLRHQISASQHGQPEDKLYRGTNLEAVSELGHS